MDLNQMTQDIMQHVQVACPTRMRVFHADPAAQQRLLKQCLAMLFNYWLDEAQK